MTRVDWRGSQVLASVRAATVAAVNETTEEAARAAASSHWWSSRTGNLQGQILSESANHTGRKVVGKFGSTRGPGFYGLFLERRTPFLRPAADRVFPTLASRIRKRVM